MFFAFLSKLRQGHEGEAATCNSGGNEDESSAGGVNEDDDNEEEEEEEEDDIPITQFEEQLYEDDDNMFVENVDNPIEEEPE
ncbi:hypothetical protein D8674_016527 [Pyrus ussuriensis x Pyrus communis]|uniref:Uncharacterized protein n=1 Tax=Pyrus ussuriensis x Pyrus communis TaxID=2448454 RepID=A0A5N5HD81_9ROSA|nr:hypothetical protein D8674_016527 [Pyrus ussuriensis x Pyrus communis]